MKIFKILLNIDHIVILCGILFLYLVTNKWFNLPFYWDSAAFLLESATEIHRTGNIFSYFNYTDYPHTFGLPLLLSFFINVHNPIASIHFVGFILSCIFLISIYYFTKIFTNKQIAVTFVFVFITNPLFLAQTNLVYFEIIGIAFRLFAISLLLKKKYLLFTGVSIIGFLFRFDNAIILILTGFIYTMSLPDMKSKIFWSIHYLSPIILTLIIWLIIHHLTVNWIFYSPQRYFEENMLLAVYQALTYILISQGRGFISIIFGGLLLYVSLFRRENIKKYLSYINFMHVLVLITLFIFPLITIGKLGYFLPRYILGTLPGYFLIIFIFFFYFVPKKVFYMLVISTILLQFIFRLDCKAGNYEDCLIVLDLLQTRKTTMIKISELAQDKTIATDIIYPIELTHKELGYISGNLKLVDISREIPDYIVIGPTSNTVFTEFADRKNYKKEAIQITNPYVIYAK